MARGRPLGNFDDQIEEKAQKTSRIFALIFLFVLLSIPALWSLIV